MPLPGIPSDAVEATHQGQDHVRSTPDLSPHRELSYDEAAQRLTQSAEYSPDPTPPTPARDENARLTREPEQGDGSVSTQGGDESGSEFSSEGDATQNGEDTKLHLDAWAERIGLPADHFAEQFIVPTKVNGEVSEVTLRELRDSYQVGKLNRQKTSQLAEREKQLNEEFETKQTEMAQAIEAIDNQAKFWDGLIEQQRKENKALLAQGDAQAYLNAEAGLDELVKKQAEVKEQAKQAREKQIEEQRKHYDSQVKRSVSEFRAAADFDDARWSEFLGNAKAYLQEAEIPESDHMIFARNPGMLRILKDALQSHTGRKAKAKARASDVLNLPRGSASQPAQVTGDRELAALSNDYEKNPTFDGAVDLIMGGRQRFQR